MEPQHPERPVDAPGADMAESHGVPERPVGEGETIRDSGFAAQFGTPIDFQAETLSDSGLAQQVAETVASHWSGVLQDSASPGMTLRGETDSGTTQSHCVAKSRSVVQPWGQAQRQKSDSEPDFKLIHQLGEGGMGVVYEARQTAIDRIVAIKMIKPHAARVPEHRAKFLAEAAVTGDLDHPNIVPIYDLGFTDADSLFYAMKKVKGTPWSKVIADKTLDENLDILTRVCDAVAYAHAKSVIHRDLKPENVMLGEFGEILVMDWGLAASVDKRGKAEPLTPATAIGGTPAYMAPEMAAGMTEAIGIRSDVYLLGAMLYEIVTGSKPHHGRELSGVEYPPTLMKYPEAQRPVIRCLYHAALNVIEPAEQRGELVEIAQKALAKDPSERFEGVKEFQACLRTYRAHAESFALATQAEDDLYEAVRDGSYDRYAQALFGFRQALELWPGNTSAAEGLDRASAAYAECASGKGDLDLAEGLLDEANPAQADLLNTVREKKERRRRKAARERTMNRVAMGLAAAVFIIVSAATGLIYREYRRAETERRRAETNERAAVEARTLAEARAGELRIEKEKVAEANRSLMEKQQELARTNDTLAAANTELNEKQDALEKALATAEARRQQAEAAEHLAQKNETLAVEARTVAEERAEALRVEKERVAAEKEKVAAANTELQQKQEALAASNTALETKKKELETALAEAEKQRQIALAARTEAEQARDEALKQKAIAEQALRDKEQAEDNLEWEERSNRARGRRFF